MLKVVRHPKSPYWYIRGTVAGEGIFESTETLDWDQAEAFRIKREGETWDRRKLGIETREPVSFAAAATAYMEKTGKTRFVGRLVEHFKLRPISLIGQDEIDKAAIAICQNTGPATRARHVYTPVLAILNNAADAELPGSRRLRVKKPKIPLVPIEWGTDDYLDRLLIHCGPNLAAIVNFMTETGARVSEAIRLRAHDLKKVEGFAYLGKTKNGKPRLIPLSEDTLAECLAVAPAKQLQPLFGYGWRTSVNTALKRACRRAGLHYLSPHKIGRHAFAARLLADGATLKEVQEAGGWESIEVVSAMYGHLERSHVHNVIKSAARKRGKSVNRERNAMRQSAKNAK
jgi:integrase